MRATPNGAGSLWPNRRWLIGGLVALALLGLVLAGMSAFRLLRGRNGPPPLPRQTDVSLIAGWMTVPYVARTFRVPGEEIFRALGLPPQGHERDSLNDLATATGRSTDEVLTIVRATVQDFQAAHPGPPPPPTPGPKGGG